MTKISRTYVNRWGGGTCADDMWYDEEHIVLFEGDKCPECNVGVLQVSKRNKLYCSALCWLDRKKSDPGLDPFNGDDGPDPAQWGE